MGILHIFSPVRICSIISHLWPYKSWLPCVAWTSVGDVWFSAYAFCQRTCPFELHFRMHQWAIIVEILFIFINTMEWHNLFIWQMFGLNIFIFDDLHIHWCMCGTRRFTRTTTVVINERTSFTCAFIGKCFKLFVVCILIAPEWPQMNVAVISLYFMNSIGYPQQNCYATTTYMNE